MTDSTRGQAQYQGFAGDDSEEEAEVAKSDQWDFSNLFGFETSIAELEVSTSDKNLPIADRKNREPPGLFLRRSN